MDDLALEAFEARLRTRLRREIAAVAMVPLAVGLLAGGMIGRFTARPAPAMQPIACEQVVKHGGAFYLDVGDNGVRMKVRGFDDD